MRTFVYAVGTMAGEPMKFGFSSKPKGRLQSLQTSNPNHLRVWSCIEATPELEGYLHDQLADLRMEGEWFRWDKRIEDALILMDYAAKVAPWRLAYTKRSRRGANEGSVCKRSDGRWVGIQSVGYSGGKRQRKSYYGATRAEAASKLEAGVEERRGRPRIYESNAEKQRAYRERK